MFENISLKHFLLNKGPVIILLLLALFTRFWNLSSPAQVVFDETHFGKFISAYFDHKYYFDIHPPLGKLMIAGFAKIFGYRAGFDFNHIGETYSPDKFFLLRFLPALFGALLPLLIYCLARAMDSSRKAAFFAGFLVLFENTILVESRFILLDIFLLFFGFAAFLFFLVFRKAEGKRKIAFLILSGLFVGLAISIKWTGLSFLAVIFFLALADLLKDLRLKKFFLPFTILAAIAFAVYFASFAVHFSLLYKSGPGDAFMSRAFQQTLAGSSVSTDTKPLSLIGKFLELNIAMFDASARMIAIHPDASHWQEWLIMRKPVWYWTKDSRQNIYLFGNPVIWLMVFLGLIIIFLELLRNKPKILKKQEEKRQMTKILVLGYLASLLPFALIKRVVFLYHYLTALIFGILILAILADSFFSLEKVPEEKPYKLKKLLEKKKIAVPKTFFGFSSFGKLFLYSGFLLLVFFSFLFFSPLSYGLRVPAGIAEIYRCFIKFFAG